jgi:hypothetical protein
MSYAAITSRRTVSPDLASAQYRSYPACISTHIRAGVPKQASSLNAVSTLMPRRSATISWMRCGGTRSFRASALAERPRAWSSSFRIAPGCTCSKAGWGIARSFSMIIDNLNIVGVAIFKAEDQSPRAIDRHRPLALPVPLQRMQSNRTQRRNIFNRSRNLQNLQPGIGLGDIHPAELRLAFFSNAFGRAVGITHDHKRMITWAT